MGALISVITDGVRVFPFNLLRARLAVTRNRNGDYYGYIPRQRGHINVDLKIDLLPSNRVTSSNRDGVHISAVSNPVNFHYVSKHEKIGDWDLPFFARAVHSSLHFQTICHFTVTIHPNVVYYFRFDISLIALSNSVCRLIIDGNLLPTANQLIIGNSVTDFEVIVVDISNCDYQH